MHHIETELRNLKSQLEALLDRVDQFLTEVCGTSEPLPLSNKESRESERGAHVREEEALPTDWEEEAVAARRRFGLPEVNLLAEWRKFLLWIEEKGRALCRAGWLRWAIRAWLDHTNQPKPTTAPEPTTEPPTADEADIRHARNWAKSGFWMPGIWGPAPDRSDCQLPPNIVRFALDLRTEYQNG